MANNRVLNFSSFNGINESDGFSKKNIGIIGPFEDGDMKIKIGAPSGFIVEDSGDDVLLSFGDNSISIPSRCCKIDGNTAIIKTKMNWFDNDENMDNFYSLVDNYISQKSGSEISEDAGILDDVSMICDLLGIEVIDPSINKNAKNNYDCSIGNKREIEISKSGSDDLFKNLRLYKNQESIHPDIHIKKKSGDFSCKYRTENGVFDTSHDNFRDILKNPIDTYLINVCLEKDDDKESEKALVDHLMKLLKYHDWKLPESETSSPEKHKKETSEIKKIMNILSNTIPEEHIEEMYTDARQRFLKSE